MSLQVGQPYSLIRSGKKETIIQLSYLDGNGIGCWLNNGNVWKFDPKTGKCLTNKNYRIEIKTK